MILHILRIRRNVYRNVFNDRKNASASTGHVSTNGYGKVGFSADRPSFDIYVQTWYIFVTLSSYMSLLSTSTCYSILIIIIRPTCFKKRPIFINLQNVEPEVGTLTILRGAT